MQHSVDLLFIQAREAVSIVYKAISRRDVRSMPELTFGVSSRLFIVEHIKNIHPKDVFKEDISAASSRDKHRTLIRKIASRAPLGAEMLRRAFEKATIIVHVRITKTLLARGEVVTGRFHKNLQLSGLMTKFDEDKVIDLAHEAHRFYIRREGQHNLTNDGAIFKALEAAMMLKTVADTVGQPEVLELFLVVAPILGTFFVVTYGYAKCSSNGYGDVGEIIKKSPHNNTIMPRTLGKDGDVYKCLQTKQTILHEDLRVGDLEKGYWVLALQGGSDALSSLGDQPEFTIGSSPQATSGLSRTDSTLAAQVASEEATTWGLVSHPQELQSDSTISGVHTVESSTETLRLLYPYWTLSMPYFVEGQPELHHYVQGGSGDVRYGETEHGNRTSCEQGIESPFSARCVTGHVRRTGDRPFAQGGFSDVWCGKTTEVPVRKLQ
ncbi:hypothetical protein FRB95_005777 [Tulasnella sp. JGI-2019a]|nr:hypothetical protein FRB95_005777 [Tulasnella sp. JGI-2019a]